MSHALVVLALAAGLATPAAAGPQAPDDPTPALASPQTPSPTLAEPPQTPPPAEAPKAVPGSTPRPAKEPPPPPGPPKAETGQFLNVKFDVTISDQRGTQPPITKTVSLTVADRGTGQIRSEGKIRVAKEGIYAVRLAVDLMRPVIEGNKVHASLAVSYDTPAAGDDTTLGTDVRHNLTIVLESGKAVTVAESADPAADRRVTLQVKATILR